MRGTGTGGNILFKSSGLRLRKSDKSCEHKYDNNNSRNEVVQSILPVKYVSGDISLTGGVKFLDISYSRCKAAIYQEKSTETVLVISRHKSRRFPRLRGLKMTAQEQEA